MIGGTADSRFGLVGYFALESSSMLTLKHHKSLTVKRWAEFGFEHQVLMIANELNRAASSLKRNDPAEVRMCYERALELMQLTLCVTTGFNRLRELARAKEVLAGLYIAEKPQLQENSLLLNALVGLSPKAHSMLNPEVPSRK